MFPRNEVNIRLYLFSSPSASSHPRNELLMAENYLEKSLERII